MTKIALFGTSADPPTAGHQTILQWLGDRYDWVAVWASDNPFKKHQTSLKHRMTMLRLLIEEIDEVKGNPGTSPKMGRNRNTRPIGDSFVNQGLSDTPRHNIRVWEELSDHRSLISVEKAKQIWGNEAEYALVIGSDLVGQICRWYRVEELLKQAIILVVPRPGYPIQEEDLEGLKKLGGNYEVANLTAPGVSSTAYREYGHHDIVTQPIQDYIHREQLYA